MQSIPDKYEGYLNTIVGNPRLIPIHMYVPLSPSEERIGINRGLPTMFKHLMIDFAIVNKKYLKYHYVLINENIHGFPI